jgi:hypothetical protein
MHRTIVSKEYHAFAVVEFGSTPLPLTVTKNRLSHRKRRKTKRVDRDVAVVAGGLTL